MTLSFLIKTTHLADKVAEQRETGKFRERRTYNRYWRKRIGSANSKPRHNDAVFLCGRRGWIADVLSVSIDVTPNDVRDVVKSDVCYVIECKFPLEEFEWISISFPEQSVC